MREVLRERNRRGEGGKLRADILAGATELLEESGSEEAVTLRAVARQVGISAPSIYTHFADREAIVEAIVDSAFADFNAAINAAVQAGSGPLARLRDGCAAYLRFAAERPNRYKLLFERQMLPDALDGLAAPDGPTAFDGPAAPVGVAAPDCPVSAIRTESFYALVKCLQDCIDAGISASTDAHVDSVAIWVALHGFATLRPNMTGFPWPDTDAVLDRIIDGLAQITSHD
jgi:AcrR family transcriptional regulator